MLYLFLPSLCRFAFANNLSSSSRPEPLSTQSVSQCYKLRYADDALHPFYYMFAFICHFLLSQLSVGRLFDSSASLYVCWQFNDDTWVALGWRVLIYRSALNKSSNTVLFLAIKSYAPIHKTLCSSSSSSSFNQDKNRERRADAHLITNLTRAGGSSASQKKRRKEENLNHIFFILFYSPRVHRGEEEISDYIFLLPD